MNRNWGFLILVAALAFGVYWAQREGWVSARRFQLYPGVNSRGEPIAWRLDTRTGLVTVCKVIPHDVGPDQTWCLARRRPGTEAPGVLLGTQPI
jgi:hypothetical protein